MSQVNHPSHYNRGRIEAALAMDALYGMGHWYAQAFKYATRAFFKGQLETDLRKAIWCAKRAGDACLKDPDGGNTEFDAFRSNVVDAIAAAFPSGPDVSPTLAKLVSSVTRFLHEIAKRDPFAGERLEKDLPPKSFFASYDLHAHIEPPATLKEQVRVFQHLIERKAPQKPTYPDRETLHLKLALITEEFFELLEAAGMGPAVSGPLFESVRNAITDHCRANEVHLPSVADALGDLDFVCEGMRQELGIDGAPIAALIAKANFTKVSGPTDPVSGKRLKPPGFVPPDIEGELIRQGMET